jgi:phospholipid-binding lipoprotein MlaA
VNTTVGVLGLFDPAEHWGMEHQPADFGQTLALWGVSQGPYLVLPVFGPSSARHAPGRAVDKVMSLTPFYFSTKESLAGMTVRAVNLRAVHDADIDNAHETAFDYYIFVRDAYEQRRRRHIWGESARVQTEEDAGEGDLYDDLYYDDLYDEPVDADVESDAAEEEEE